MTSRQSPTSTISSIILGHIRSNYRTILEQAIQNERHQADFGQHPKTREGINIIAELEAPPAYILAVAGVEAYLNEVYLGSMAKSYLKRTPLDNVSDLERLDIRTKLIDLPQRTFNNTFQKAQQPYQDMATLIKLRNDFVHYKMEPGEPKYLKTLQNRRIALDWPDVPWTFALSTSEGIRWAHNTACKTILKLYEFLPPDYRSMMRNYMQDFVPISKGEVISQFAENKINIEE